MGNEKMNKQRKVITRRTCFPLWDVILLHNKIENLPRLFRAMELFLWEFAFFTSVNRHEPVDKNLQPVPWLTYPAIEFLNRLNFKSKSVFEFGAGNSSLYFSGKGASVFSVESDLHWYNRLSLRIANNNKLYYAKTKKEYLESIKKPRTKFDVVLIDGLYRYSSSSLAIKYLKPTGFIILDNSEWFPRAFAQLESCGFTHVDFSGFSPFNDYTLTTSIFFKKSSSFDFDSDKNAHYSIGSIKHISPEDR